MQLIFMLQLMVKITKQDISMALQDPRIDFDKLPETAKTSFRANY